MSKTPESDPRHGTEEEVRPHVFDGIEEYNKRLPNWWLLTFYGAIAFAIVYWFYYAHADLAPSDGVRVTAEIARIEAAKLSSNLVIDDEHLWQMSQSPAFIAGGKATFNSLCAACHLTSLRGKEESAAAIGPSLVDTEWVHGGQPTDIYRVIDAGVLEKGMPAWGPVLGTKKAAEVAAYVLSFHREGE